MKGLLIALIVLLAAGGAYYIYRAQPEAEVNANAQEEVDATTVSGMRVEENAVVTPEQRPGTTVRVAQVYLAAPGYVVIHEDQNGAPGAILGASTLLQAGESSDVVVTLSRSSSDGERLWSMLHSETNGDASFNASADMPVQSHLGGPLSGWFEVRADASTDVQINL